MKKLVGLLLLLTQSALFCTRPIVLVHGILADEHDMQPTIDYIHKYLPGTYIHNIKIGNGGLASAQNIFHQGQMIIQEISADPELSDGFNMICHSQGGLIGRYYIEKCNHPRVYNYISWGSPQMGVCGTPGTYDDRFTFLNYLEQLVWYAMYTTFFQNYTSIAGYWRDTIHYSQYLSYCSFLPILNNEKQHVLFEQFRENICSLENMILVQSPSDDIIEPLESCHFGYYKIGSLTEKETVYESEWFKQDALGLRTLHESNRLHLLYSICTHTDYQENEANFVVNTLPFLIAS